MDRCPKVRLIFQESAICFSWFVGQRQLPLPPPEMTSSSLLLSNVYGSDFDVAELVEKGPNYNQILHFYLLRQGNQTIS